MNINIYHTYYKILQGRTLSSLDYMRLIHDRDAIIKLS